MSDKVFLDTNLWSISSGLENDCKLLYSEDLQGDHVIEGKLKIVNPL
jgi:predicted nucleic acid-binding protein